MKSFRAFRVHRDGDTFRSGVESITLDELSPGDVLLRAAWSGVNYKDALAGTGRGRIMRRFPLVAGVDVAGHVAESGDGRFRQGDPVLVTGYGLSQDHDGGYAEYVRVPGDWVVPLPAGLSPYQAMALGTAGFTAALGLERMQVNGQAPGMGPILVTGASGGVGSLAVEIFSAAGYEVVAVSGKPEAADYLRALGAAEVIGREAVAGGGRPLEHGRWGGAVDNVGGEMLAQVASATRPGGNIAAIGLAGGHELHTTVMPFIIRGVSLLGINSVDCPMPLRRRVWERLATDLAPRRLDAVVSGVVDFDDLPAVFDAVLAGRHRGRTLVRIANVSNGQENKQNDAR